ncbi:MAG: ATP-dependent DNA helicase RecG [Actinobacteria bacterium]|nr:ATP-dependent DNA helicase RecG [Actinomycetota bacterium]
MATLSRLTQVSVGELKGIGSSRLATLAKSGIRTVADMLHHVPRDYLDRTEVTPIAKTLVGPEVTVVGEVRSVSSRRARGNLQITEARIGDDSGEIKAVWFTKNYPFRKVKEGDRVALSGVVERFRGSLQMKTPDAEVLDEAPERILTGRIVPIHPQVGKVSPQIIRDAVHNALKRSRPIDDPLPVEFKAARGLMDRDQAFASIHFPESREEIGPARKRLVYDELFRLELALAMKRRHMILEAKGTAHAPTGELAGPFLDRLPYRLTAAQARVLDEIRSDLTAPHPMHRLLQGEVGSGKTVVAVASLLDVIEGGHQTAIMAPTEVLAEQHYLGVNDLLAKAALSPGLRGEGERLGMESLFSGEEDPAVHLGLLTGSAAAANYDSGITRPQLLADVASGQVDLLVGTHALIQEGVAFSRLGAAVIDEQHRFGVAQRVRLKEKSDGAEPDLLIMTATPIPRTLSMTLYGDLDVSVIDEMPPGRSPVRTRLLSKAEEWRAIEHIEKEVGEGRQAFVVCPLVEDSPKVEAVSAVSEHRRLSLLMPDLRVGLIHGQLPSREKEEVMASLRAGELDAERLEVEVGIDVPNATVMVILDADRFGLSQLHQLRGRVGRGSHPGTCLLLADASTQDAVDRLDAMVGSNDGFRLAEEDLRIRGHGTVFGTRQSGMNDLVLADIMADLELLVAARRDAFGLVDSDPELADHPELAEEVSSMLGETVDWLFIA